MHLARMDDLNTYTVFSLSPSGQSQQRVIQERSPERAASLVAVDALQIATTAEAYGKIGVAFRRATIVAVVAGEHVNTLTESHTMSETQLTRYTVVGHYYKGHPDVISANGRWVRHVYSDSPEHAQRDAHIDASNIDLDTMDEAEIVHRQEQTSVLAVLEGHHEVMLENPVMGDYDDPVIVKPALADLDSVTPAPTRVAPNHAQQLLDEARRRGQSAAGMALEG